MQDNDKFSRCVSLIPDGAQRLLVACSETYEYYKLPYCKPKDGVRYKTLGMGEVSTLRLNPAGHCKLSLSTSPLYDISLQPHAQADRLSLPETCNSKTVAI